MSYAIDPVKPYVRPAQSFALGGSVNKNPARSLPAKPWQNDPERQMKKNVQPLPDVNSGAIVDTPLAPSEGTAPRWFGDTPNAMSYDLGGEVGGNNIGSALDVVDQALAFGRKANGLGGGQQQAAAMPMVPGKQSDYPGPAPRPTPGGGQQLSAIPDDTNNGRIQSFDDGGAVEDDDPSMRYTADQPPAQQDSQTGAPPSSAGEDDMRYTADLPQQSQGVSRIINYLRGGDGDHKLADQLAKQVDPSAHMDDNERNLAVVNAANEQGGPEAAWKVVQANRQAFNAKQAFARAALNGVEGKPPDVAAAAKAATQAFPHMLDGTNVEFTPSQTGVTVAVKKLGQGQPFQKTDLSVAQFNDLLNMGKDGMYDNLIENGIGPVLQQLKAKPGTPVQGEQGQGNQPFTTPGIAQHGSQPAAQPAAQPAQANAAPDIDPQIERRAARLFPSVSQSAQRNAWMQSQIEAQQSRTGKLAEAEAGWKGREATARVTGQYRVGAADVTGQHREAASQNYAGGRVAAAQVLANARTDVGRSQLQASLVRAGATVLAKQIGNVPFGTELSPQAAQAAADVINRMNGGGSGAPAAPAPASPAAPSAPAQGKRPPPGWVKVQ